MSPGSWDQDPDHLIHGTLESDEEVTVKDSLDGTEALIARGFLDDIQPDIDHVHVWGQGSDSPDHHDMRWSDPLFDDSEGDEDIDGERGLR